MEERNYTELDIVDHIALGISYVIQTPAQAEQARTTIKKALFLECFAKSMGVVLDACQKAEVSRALYYVWKKEDPEFARKLEEVTEKRNSYVEDKLFQKIENGDGPSIRFYLNAKHADYKKKVVNEIYTGDKTLEDIIDEQNRINAELDNQPNNGNTLTPEEGTDGQSVSDGEPAQNPQQAGNTSTVQVEHNPAVLLPAQDAPKPDSQISPTGAKQGN